MIKDIYFSPHSTSLADTLAKEGEVYTPYCLIDCGGGAYRNAPRPAATTSTPDGYRIAAIHRLGETINLIVAGPKDAVSFLSCTEIPEQIEAESLTFIATIHDITGICQSGSVLTVATTERIIYLIYCDGAYRVLDEMPAMPVIEFGLQQAGTLACADTIVIRSETVAAAIGASQTGSSASRVHPSTSGDREEATDISKTLNEAYLCAVRSQCTAKGYVDRPFFVRYALRMHCGSYIMASPPVLMLPTVLPPRIGVTARAADSDTTVMTIDLSDNRYFQLRQRILSDYAPQWSGIIASVDIFVSKPVDTYDADGISYGHITDYSAVADEMDSGGFLRGRHYPNRDSRAEGRIFDGHYSAGGDCYIDHYLDTQAARSVWHLAPNHRLQDELMCTGTFYRIASIPYEDMSRSGTFSPVQLLSADFGRLSSHLTLGAEAMPGTAVIPSAITEYAGQIVIASDRVRPLPVPPLRSMAAYYGDATAQGLETEVRVYSHRCGRTLITSCRCEGMGSGISDTFPRYLYCSDTTAYMMTLTQGGRTVRLPLTPHESMPGAYWWGGIGDNFIPEASAVIPDGESPATISTGTRIYTSMPANPLCLMPEPLQIGDTEVIAIRSALEAPKLGSFGQYPLYAFATNGVWMLQYSDARATVVSAKMISRDVAQGRLAITEVDDAIWFMSDGRLMSAVGSKVQCVSSLADCLHFDVRLLPHHLSLLDAADAELIEDDSASLLKGAVLTYQPESAALHLGNPDKDYALLYPVATGGWSVCDTNGGSRGLLITRPIRLASPTLPVDVASVEVMGCFMPGHVMTAVYGTDRISHWHLIGSSTTEKVTDFCRRRYRYICVAVITDLAPNEYISGLQVEY